MSKDIEFSYWVGAGPTLWRVNDKTQITEAYTLKNTWVRSSQTAFDLNVNATLCPPSKVEEIKASFRQNCGGK